MSAPRPERTKAITTPLSPSRRAAPASSPAPAYEPRLRVALRHRLISTVLIHSAIVMYMMSAVSDATRGYSVWGMLSVRTLAVAVVKWTVGVVPIVLLRAMLLTATTTSGTSPLTAFKSALHHPRAFWVLFTYFGSAVLLLALYMAQADPESRLTLFVRSRKHPLYVNGRILSLVVSQCIVALAHFFRGALLDRWVLRLNSDGTYNSLASLSPLAILLPAFLLSLVSVIGLLPALLGLRIPLLLIAPRAIVRGTWLAPISWRYFGVLVKAWALGAWTLGGWELAEYLMDVVMPVKTSLGAPPAVLISAIAGNSFPPEPTPTQLFALAELKDAKPADVYEHWHDFVRVALGILGRDLGVFERRGAAAPPPAAVPAPPKKEVELKNVKLAALNASSSALRPVPSRTVDILAFEEPAPLDLAAQLAKLRARVPVSVPTVGTGLETVRWGWEWMTKEREWRKAEEAMSGREVDLGVVQVLEKLVCASLTEDTFGRVQRDIPRVLEALVRWLAAVDAYQAELAALPPSEEVARAGAVVGPLHDALKQAVASIVRTFGERLRVFKFPVGVGRRLQLGIFGNLRPKLSFGDATLLDGTLTYLLLLFLWCGVGL